MLFALQHPICDTRIFGDDERHRLKTPPWPLPEPDEHFVRCIGGVERRKRGFYGEFCDEQFYCSTFRGLKFDKLESRFPLPSRKSRPPACAFRRLFSNGRCVVRVEVGLGLHGYQYLSGAEAVSLVTYCLGVPIRLNRLRASTVPSTLQGAGALLADLYAEATTSLNSGGAVSSDRVIRSGRPVALLEYEGEEFQSLPEKATTLDPASVCGAKLSFTWIHSKGRDIGLWLLDSSSILPAQARDLRLCLFRLHAEQQSLKIILREIIQGQIQYKCSTPSGDRLEAYLNDATRMISKEHWHGISQDAIRSTIGAYDEVVAKGETAVLLKELEGARLQIRRKLEDYAKERELPPRPVNVVVQGDVYQAQTFIREVHSMTVIKTEIGDGNVFHGDVVTAESIKGSFNRVAQSANAPALARALKDLTQLVAKMCEKLPPGEARAKARDLDTLVREATCEEPRPAEVKRLGDGLVDAAKTVAGLIGPITAAVKVVLSWFGL